MSVSLLSLLYYRVAVLYSDVQILMVIDNNSVLHTDTYNVYYYKTHYMFRSLNGHHQVPRVTS
jgi:hypothetical protein